MNGWYARPVFFVENVERAVSFFTEKLGFTEGPRFEAEGRLLVGQADRRGCSIILSCQWPGKNGGGRLFVSLETEEWIALKTEFHSRGAPVEEEWWGGAVMVVRDPDGNELFFPDPASPG